MAPSEDRLCYGLAGRGTGFRFPEDYKIFVVVFKRPDRKWVPPPSSPVVTGCSLIVDKPYTYRQASRVRTHKGILAQFLPKNEDNLTFFFYVFNTQEVRIVRLVAHITLCVIKQANTFLSP
jgi:hypothetical protein